MSSFITTHDPKTGLSKFSSQVPESQNPLPIPSGTVNWLYSSHATQPDISNGNDNDIQQFAHDRVNGMPNGSIAPPQGFSASVFTLDGGKVGAMHRTLTLDVLLLVEGVVELWLDGGEMRVVKAGDSVVQRGTMHQWKNITPNNGIAKFAAFTVPISGPFEVAGKEMKSTFSI